MKGPRLVEQAESPLQATGKPTTNRLHTGFVWLITTDLVARTGYQMGKSPVLPLFASALGASPEAAGVIIAVSTTTGLFTSPLIGTLSDLYGRRRLLMAGTAIFAFIPFLYLLVQTPNQLLAVRLVHGFGTAIYGPVLAAQVADMFTEGRAGYMGWYRAARTASYLLGPLLGGIVLVAGDFRLAWISVGLLGLLSFVPALALTRSFQDTASAPDSASRSEFIRRLAVGFRNPTLLSLGLVQAALFIGLRANKAFLPIYAVDVGLNPAQIGAIFSIQVAATMVGQPAGGYFSDRWGRRPAILLGLMLVAVGLPLMVMTGSLLVLAILSIVLGLGEALVMPSMLTLGTELSSQDSYGATLGMLDAMDNVGKALGPIVAGLLLGWFSYPLAFTIIAGMLLVVGWLGGLEMASFGKDAIPSPPAAGARQSRRGVRASTPPSPRHSASTGRPRDHRAGDAGNRPGPDQGP